LFVCSACACGAPPANALALAFTQQRPVLLHELPRSKIKEVHGRIGTVLERGVGRDVPLDDLSEHYYQAERAEKCVCFSLLAGQRALAEGRWQGAREHFQKVLDATEGGGFPEERISSMEGIADADAALGRAEEARCWYRLLLDERPPTVVRDRVQRKMQ
jgi:tetratricopeptide (TPR) repeat protein